LLIDVDPNNLKLLFSIIRTTHDEEIAIRLATRRAEQRLRQEEHELNMEIMKQRVKTAPLLLEGPPQLSSRLGHIYHHCDITDDKKKVNNMLTQQNVTKNKSSKDFHPHESMNSSDDSKINSETGSINSKYS
jgi:Tfp pilus assembly protein PilX